MTNLVIIKDNQAMTTSRMVAATFEKDHKHIIRDVKSLECSDFFRQSNFGLSSYLSDQNKELPEYNLTRDGFTFLAMGYTGKKAAQFKEAYIKAFNEMEASLKVPVLLENKYTIEDLIIAQANSIKELKSEVQAMQMAITDKIAVAPIQIEVGQQKLFPVNQLVTVNNYAGNRNYTTKTLSYLGRMASRYSKENGLEYKKLGSGNLYQAKAIDEAIGKAVISNQIQLKGVLPTSPTIDTFKIIEQLKKNPLAQELKNILVGKSKSYRGNLASILKNVIYQKIHKCSELRFTISATIKSKGWVKVTRIN